MKERMDRREFSVALALAMLGGAAISLSQAACGGGDGYGGGGNPTGSSGGGDDYGPGGNADPGGGEVASISANHGHRAVITQAELTAGNGLNLDIQGSASHSHAVLLSGAEVVAIRGGQRVSKPSSSTDAHSHNVTFN